MEIAHGPRRILGPVNLSVPPGEVVTVMGPSGCGKSSLLAAICGTLDPALTARGRVLLNGEDVTARPPETRRSEEHTSELQSLMRTSYAVFCLKKKKNKK